jgi:phosphoribosylformimino-5-aminoimidazole carboxamide ribotide isomerase
MDIVPAVDVLSGKVVRLSRGDYKGVSLYGDDPAAQVAAWGAQGARLVHVVDLDGARFGTPDPALLASLRDCRTSFQIGGGIRTAARAHAAIAAGATRVVMGTAAVWEPEVLDEAIGAIGREVVVVALDVRDGKARGGGWLDDGVPIADLVARISEQGVSRCLVTGISGDGMMAGPDLGLLREVRAAAPQLTILASGGVGTLDHVAALAEAGFEAAIIGRALYEGRFTLAEAAEAAMS